jgi:hypothetical protein
VATGQHEEKHIRVTSADSIAASVEKEQSTQESCMLDQPALLLIGTTATNSDAAPAAPQPGASLHSGQHVHIQLTSGHPFSLKPAMVTMDVAMASGQEALCTSGQLSTSRAFCSVGLRSESELPPL